MKKTVGTLCVGEYLFEPTIDEIHQRKIEKIEKTKEGTKVDLGTYYFSIDYCDNCSDASSIVTYRNGQAVQYVRYEDALEVQRVLQKEHLKGLQKEATFAMNKLNDFIDKYFN